MAAEDFNREGDVNPKEDKAIIDGLKRSRPKSKKVEATTAILGQSSKPVTAKRNADGTVSRVKDTTVRSVVKTLQGAGASFGSGVQVPLGGKKFTKSTNEQTTKNAKAKFFKQFRGMSDDEIEDHRRAGTFAEYASTPEEEQAHYESAKSAQNYGGSRAQGYIKKKKAEDAAPVDNSQGHWNVSEQSWLGKKVADRPGLAPVTEMYTGPNHKRLSSDPMASLGALHDLLENHLNELDPKGNSAEYATLRGHLRRANNSIGNAGIAYLEGRFNDGPAMDPSNLRSTRRGAPADSKYDTSSPGLVTHLRQASESIKSAANTLEDHHPDFKAANGADLISNIVGKASSKGKPGSGIIGQVDSDLNGGVPNKLDLAKGMEAISAYDITRQAFKRGNRSSNLPKMASIVSENPLRVQADTSTPGLPITHPLVQERINPKPLTAKQQKTADEANAAREAARPGFQAAQSERIRAAIAEQTARSESVQRERAAQQGASSGSTQGVPALSAEETAAKARQELHAQIGINASKAGRRGNALEQAAEIQRSKFGYDADSKKPIDYDSNPAAKAVLESQIRERGGFAPVAPKATRTSEFGAGLASSAYNLIHPEDVERSPSGQTVTTDEGRISTLPTEIAGTKRYTTHNPASTPSNIPTGSLTPEEERTAAIQAAAHTHFHLANPGVRTAVDAALAEGQTRRAALGAEPRKGTKAHKTWAYSHRLITQETSEKAAAANQAWNNSQAKKNPEKYLKGQRVAIPNNFEELKATFPKG